MKWFTNILIILCILMTYTEITFSQISRELTLLSEKKGLKEENYLTTLNSGNEEIRINSAYILGELKSQKAVEPLMDMFRKEKDDGAKLVAALSLLKIGDARGVFLVKRSIEFGEDSGTTIILQHLFKDYSISKKELLD